jgi:hypothetical protein
MPDLTAGQILRAIREHVPELEREGRWPATIVVDAFADYVAARVRGGAPADELASYFAFVEELASSGDPAAENLVVVDFLEAAPWGALGAAALLGPATARLARAETDLLQDHRA